MPIPKTNDPADDWGKPLPPEEPGPVAEPEEQITPEDIQTGALVSIARSFDRLATVAERLLALAEKEVEET